MGSAEEKLYNEAVDAMRTYNANDAVNHPSHYTSYKGIEIIDLTEQMNFNRGNAVKYIARAGLKNPNTEIEDLEKAVWYIQREIDRLGKNAAERELERLREGNRDKEAMVAKLRQQLVGSSRMVDINIKDGSTAPKGIKVAPHCPQCNTRLEEEHWLEGGKFVCPNGHGEMLFGKND